MNINELIANVKKKLELNINIQNILIEDKTFLHKNHKSHDPKKFHLKIKIYSNELKALNKIEEIYRKYDVVKKKHNIRNGFLLITVGNYGFLIEPVWFWPDSRLKMYDTVMRKDHLNTLSSFDSDKEGRRIVQNMRDDLSQLFITGLYLLQVFSLFY